jgi:hypothetical protein
MANRHEFKSEALDERGFLRLPARLGMRAIDVWTLIWSCLAMKPVRALLLLVFAAIVLTHPVATQPAPLSKLHVVGDHFVDGTGATVVLRGAASMGMGMVYGDKANHGTYLPMTPAQYIDRAIQTDATGVRWWANSIRLNFERFPSASPGRLYTIENSPYAMPDTIAFAPWRAGASYAEGNLAGAGRQRWRVVKKSWRADRGFPWNAPAYAVGDLVVGLADDASRNSWYRCIKVEGTGPPGGHWERSPRGTATYVEDQGGIQYTWEFVGPFGVSGDVPPSSLRPLTDNQATYYIDGRVSWQRLGNDYTPAQAAASFADWQAKVLDPVVQRAIDDRLYVVICEFDFGPAHNPLRRARMLDLWPRLARSKWGNHPQVIFELWNESEDIGTFAGGPGSWSQQKPVVQEVVNAIREIADNVIIIPTPFYSAWVGEATASPVVGSNLVYAWHQYRSQWEMYASNRAQIEEGLASGLPIVVTEWGDDTDAPVGAQWPTTTTVPPALRVLLEGGPHPVAGWFAWSMSQAWSPRMFSDAALTRPTPFGIAARDWMLDLHNGGAPSGPPR